MAIVMVGDEESAANAGKAAQHYEEDICTRTSWVDARTALSHINKGRASGSRVALWVRKILQDQLYQLGEFSESHAGKIVFVAILVMAAFCAVLKGATLITDIEKLWVEEGGRLEREVNYISKALGEGSGTTNQILIQTPKEGFKDNILTPASLLTHLQALLAATKITVDKYDTTWSLNDLCFATSFPYFENHIIDKIFENLTPCAIITPLDCFWEGSKLLGPEFYVTIPGYGELVKWTNLNPQKIVKNIKEFQNSENFFPFSSFVDFMKRAGITTAYQEKPCLHPEDPECPTTAPNKKSLKPPEIGVELTGGCYGFAGKYLHWPEELIVGGVKKNRTGHIVRGEALQSIVQLMGPKDLFEHWQDHYKVHSMDWSQEKAEIILSTWVDKFSQKIKETADKLSEETKPYNLHPFSSSALTKLIRAFSAVSVPRLVAVCIALIIYTCLSSMHVDRTSHHDSSVGLSLAGVLLVIGSVASGLGLSVLLRLPFSAATTQVLPVLTLSLGVRNVFLMISTVREVALTNTNNKGVQCCQVGDIMKRCGISVGQTSLCNASGFFAAAIIPIPALKVFCLQAGLVSLTTLTALLLVFPAFISLDLRRRNKGRVDFFCCLPTSIFQIDPKDSQAKQAFSGQNDVKRTAVTRVLSPPGRGTVTRVLCTPSSEECWVGAKPLQAHSPSLESLTAESTGSLVKRSTHSKDRTCDKIFSCSLKVWIRDTYCQVITQGGTKAGTILCFFLTIAASIWGVSRLKDGLDLTDIVPTGTPEYEFLNYQQKYFGFYNMFAVTQGNFEYPTNQKLLHEYHEAFNRVPWIIKNDNGGLPDTWLALFRDWLKGLQHSFDSDWEKGLITEEGWKRNASDNGILAYKLLVQTGHVDHPVDTSLVTQIRLVDGEGIINPKAFYNYLTAWVSNDALAYTASQANLVPMPRNWYHERFDYDLKIPKSLPIIYAQLPFYLSDLDDTETITNMIATVRSICKKYEDKGLPNFPSGVPFTFWEQYINLRFYLLLALVTVFGIVFLLLTVLLVNVWAASLVVLILATMVLQLSGLLGVFGLKLSAAPAIMLIISVGIGAEFLVHVTIGFLTSLGDRNRRVRISLTHLSVPMLNGAVSTLLAISLLLFSDFDFAKRYFFVMIAASVILGALDGLLFLPVLFTLVGPPADLISKTSSDRVFTPSPPPTPQPQPHHHYSYSVPSSSGRRSSSKQTQSHTQTPQHSQRRPYPANLGSNLSLSTISEEPASIDSTNSSPRSSHEILVEPQVVVETTTFNGPHKHTCPSDSSEGVIYHEGHHVTTTVTATAKVKVELHNKSLAGVPEAVHKAGPSSTNKCSNNRNTSSCSCSSCSSHPNISISNSNKYNRSSGASCATTSSSSCNNSLSSSSSSDKGR